MDASFPCEQCGADLKFAPGTAALVCPYCGHENPIPDAKTTVVERDYHAILNAVGAEQVMVDLMVVKCTNCAAETEFDPNITGDECPFCGTSLVHAAQSKKAIQPQAVLPFHITQREAQTAFQAWLKGLWFAPNALKARAQREGKLSGVYLPFWTYDTDTTTDYTGQRGEHYWVTQTYTAMENGKAVTKTRQVRHTRWYPARGRVFDQFDDVLVPASTSLPEKYLTELAPWDLPKLVPFNPAYLSGFRTESYQLDLPTGFDLAQTFMAPIIDQSIRRDIGGDEQQISSKKTEYDNITFKHILLPIWISAYRFDENVYRFLVNARTGEVQGERPWSWIKITFAVLMGLLVIAVIIFLANQSGA